MFDFWTQQEDKPLFPDILWSRPENKNLLPKLSILGGSKAGFAKTALIYQHLQESGSGPVKILLPSSLRNQIPPHIDSVFVESTQTGSFGKELINNAKAASSVSNLMIISEDTGKESEFTQSIYTILSDDYIDVLIVGEASLTDDTYFDTIIERKQDTILVVNPVQLQKIASRLPTTVAFQSTDGLIDLIKGLHEITSQVDITFVVVENSNVVIAGNGKVYSTKTKTTLEDAAARCASFHNKPLTHSYITAFTAGS